MTSINRKKKHVVVNSNYIVPYDHLILATGLQHQVPAPLTSRKANNRFTQNPAKNLFLVNDQYDAAVFLYWVETHLLNKDYSDTTFVNQIVIYGQSLESFCSVQTLIELGLPGRGITLVLPHKSTRVSHLHKVNAFLSSLVLKFATNFVRNSATFSQFRLFLLQPSVFNNPVVDAAVKKALGELEVNVIEDKLLNSWNLDEETPEVLTSVQFINVETNEISSVPCSVRGASDFISKL